MTSKKTKTTKPKRITDVTIKNLKPKDGKQWKFTIGDGLFLLITKTGSKLWRYKYRFEGSEKSLSMGKYPVVGLNDAKQKHLEAMKLLDQGIDPQQKNKPRNTNSKSKNTNSPPSPENGTKRNHLNGLKNTAMK